MLDKTKDAPDLADIQRQMEALREEFSRTVSLMTSTAEGKAGQAASRVSERATELSRLAERRGEEARSYMEDAVRNNPLTMLGAAAALGLLVGALTRR